MKLNTILRILLIILAALLIGGVVFKLTMILFKISLGLVALGVIYLIVKLLK